jgi:hypothetical protein
MGFEEGTTQQIIFCEELGGHFLRYCSVTIAYNKGSLGPPSLIIMLENTWFLWGRGLQCLDRDTLNKKGKQ